MQPRNWKAQRQKSQVSLIAGRSTFPLEGETDHPGRLAAPPTRFQLPGELGDNVPGAGL
jgi:hypothetical protein